MIELISLVYYLSIGMFITLPVIGVAIGQGIANQSLIEAINRQPASAPLLKRLFAIIMASLETSVILPAIMCIPLLSTYPQTVYAAVALLGMVIALAIPGLVIGIAASLPSKASIETIARNPHAERSAINILIISLSIIQTPIIFGLIISWFQYSQISDIVTAAQTLKIIGSGIALGIGSIGPAIGIGMFAQQAITGVGLAPKTAPQLLSFTFLSQAIIETPILFTLITAITILFVDISPKDPLLHGIIMLLAGITIALPTVMIGLSSSRTARSACKQIPKYPEAYQQLSRTSILGQAIIDTTVLYCLIISFFLIFSR